MLLALGVAACGACSRPETATTDELETAVEAGPPPVPDRPKGFWARRLSLVHRDGDRLRLRLSLESLVHRRRATKFFVYENRDELLIRAFDAEFVEPVAGGPTLNRGLPLRELAEALRGIGELPPLTGTGEAGDAEVDVLSRILFEGLSIRIAGPHPLRLTARLGEVGGDFRDMRFDGAVRLTTDRCTVEAPGAIWSGRHQGFLFPAGYRHDGRRRSRAALLGITTGGTCRVMPPPAGIGYVDPLEHQEAAVFSRLLDELPAYARFVLGIGLPSGPRP